eukprot:6615658-Prymnesium_polylepis.1
MLWSNEDPSNPDPDCSMTNEELQKARPSIARTACGASPTPSPFATPMRMASTRSASICAW